MIEDRTTNDLTLFDYANGWDITGALFKQEVVKRELLYWRVASWPCAATTFRGAPVETVHHFIRDGTEAQFIRVGGCSAHVEIQDGELRAQVAGNVLAEVESAIDWLRETFPLADVDPADRRVPMYLWVLTPNGARKIRRMIDVPSWSDVTVNYAAKPQTEMASLVEGRPESGRIILWHGPPGTGKS